MARLAVSAFIPSADTDLNLTVAGTTASSAQVIGKNRIFAINATQDMTIAFGISSGGAAASAGSTNYRIPAGAQILWDTGSSFDEFEVYNLSATSMTVYVKFLSMA